MIEVNSEGARVATALAGKACCTVAQPQDRPLLESAAFHELFDFSKLQGVKNAQGVIAVQRTYATANKATVQAFLASVSSAITAEKQDKAGSLTLIRKYLDLDKASGSGTPTPSEASAEQISNTIYDYFVGQVIPVNPVVSADQFTDGITILASKNDKLKGFDMSKYVDDSYLETAKKS